MAFRIGSHVIGGEISNQNRNSVNGWLAFGPDEGLHLNLTGNLSGELCHELHERLVGHLVAPVLRTLRFDACAESGFANGTFITQLQQGQAGRLANALAGNSLYLCRMVGSALPACNTLGYSAAG